VPMKPADPVAIICLTRRGQHANVAFRYDGKKYVDLFDPVLRQRRTETFRRYRVFIEVPWEHAQIKQIAVPGLTEEEAQRWVQGIDIRDVAPPINTGGLNAKPN
jgi:hypothetical protein